MTKETTGSSYRAAAIWMALGTFAIGTEGFMIAPLLSRLAASLSVSVSACGQLVTVFALTYALSSPILTALSGGLNRRTLLIGSMTTFSLANVVAWHAGGYLELMGARVLLAISAGLYVPCANALASTLAPPEKRGTALAIVNGGLTIAVAIGAPLGSVIGNGLGWRMTFALVGTLAVIATVGLTLGLSTGVGAGIPVATLRERVSVARQPSILLALLATTLWAIGTYTVFTYLAPFLATATGIEGGGVSLVVGLWGTAAALGIASGGILSDRFGTRSVIIPGITILAIALASLSLSAIFLPKSTALTPVLAAVFVWGFSAWSFFPAQQARLVGISGLKLASIVLSLNASFMYVGFSAGAAIGSIAVGNNAVGMIGLVGAAFEVVALLLILATKRRSSLP